jgi:hypothetical protein
MLSFPVFVAPYPRRTSTPPHLCGPGAFCVEIPLPRSPLTCCDHTVLILSGRSRPVWDPVGVAVHYCLKSFTCNTYGPPRKCCKQKTYGQAKPFRCNTYRKHGGWATASSAASHSPLLSCSCAQALSFHTLAHSLARRKNQPLYFQALPHSLPKNTRVGVPQACSIEAPSQLWAGRSHPSHCGAKPLMQQFAKARDFFTIRGNNSALPGV